MRISARNILQGTIEDVVKGQTTAHVRIKVGAVVITASITNEAVDELGLKKGMAASAVIKASDVMVGSNKLLSMRSLSHNVACAAVLVLGVWSGSANAAGKGCEAFAWPIDADKAAFAKADIESVTSGTARGAWKQQAFLLKLQPEDSVSFVVKPGGKSKKTPAHGGLLTFDAPETAGTFQVTLSDSGWIDLVQNGASVKSSAHTGAKECAGVRKSLRFEVGKAPVVLQVSGVKGEEIKVAISPVK